MTLLLVVDECRFLMASRRGVPKRPLLLEGRSLLTDECVRIFTTARIHLKPRGARTFESIWMNNPELIDGLLTTL